jgi:methionyl-tRNA synthetase
VLADVMARFQRQNGREVYFLTGVDQHGQKVQKSADKGRLSPQAFRGWHHPALHRALGKAERPL